MKKLFSFFLFCLFSTFGFTQEASSNSDESGAPKYTKKYFISSNSGIQTTPVGFRVGFLDKRGAYLAARFGNGNTYRYDGSINSNKHWLSEKGTLFSATVGLILPIYYRDSDFTAHFFSGIGYGQWFNRAPINGTKMGLELESGFMLSYSKVMLTIGGNFLVGDGGTPRTDLQAGLGYRIY